VHSFEGFEAYSWRKAPKNSNFGNCLPSNEKKMFFCTDNFEKLLISSTHQKTGLLGSLCFSLEPL